MLLGIWLAALALLIYFSVSQSSQPLLAALAVAWLFSGWASLWAWWQSSSGLLQWDGEHWHWLQNGSAQTCRVRIVWDFQQLLLVRMTATDAASQWLWLESGGSLLQWNALRRALVSASAEFTEPSPTNDLEGQR